MEKMKTKMPENSEDLSLKDLANSINGDTRKKAVTAEEEDENPSSSSVDFSKALQEAREQPPVPFVGAAAAADSGSFCGGGFVRVQHSNLCAVCSSYVISFFRHRCLVCGRMYCSECVFLGMGNMAEGRKCLRCLGRRFSQRYIHKAGQLGCFCFRYPKRVRQQELIWAEKGPRNHLDDRRNAASVIPVTSTALGSSPSGPPAIAPGSSSSSRRAHKAGIEKRLRSPPPPPFSCVDNEDASSPALSSSATSLYLFPLY